MNLPNALTLLRIFFVPLLVAALVQGHVTINLGFMAITNEMLALSLFLAAAAPIFSTAIWPAGGARSRRSALCSTPSPTNCWFHPR